MTRVATEWPWHPAYFPEGLVTPVSWALGVSLPCLGMGNGGTTPFLATRTHRSPREQPIRKLSRTCFSLKGLKRERGSCRLDEARDRGASPRPLVTLSSTSYPASTCVLSNRLVRSRALPVNRRGSLVFGRASHLGMFSADPYPDTSAAQRCRWHDEPLHRGPSIPVLSY